MLCSEAFYPVCCLVALLLGVASTHDARCRPSSWCSRLWSSSTLSTKVKRNGSGWALGASWCARSCSGGRFSVVIPSLLPLGFFRFFLLRVHADVQLKSVIGLRVSNAFDEWSPSCVQLVVARLCPLHVRIHSYWAPDGTAQIARGCRAPISGRVRSSLGAGNAVGRSGASSLASVASSASRSAGCYGL